MMTESTLTYGELIKIITRRAIVRSYEEPVPMMFLGSVIARVTFLRERAAITGRSIEAELVEMGRELGLLVMGVEKVN
ncbi:MAG: hypothetical protein WBZ01_21490 [Terriglobales bacterium]|jgi:hypothetical protein